VKTPTFVPSDVTVLLAIAWTREEQPASLKDIVARGDLLWRVSLTGPEIRRAVAKLIAAGHIEDRNCSFVLAGEALETWRMHQGRGHHQIWWHDTFERLLNPDPDYRPSGYLEDDPDWRYEPFDDETVRIAADLFRKEFWAEHEAAKAARSKRE
jgi:hypothetical protein